MKIGIFTQSLDIYENRRLIEAAIALGHEAELIRIQDTVLEVGGDDRDEKNGIFYAGKNLKTYDFIMIRYAFSYTKQILAITEFLRHYGVKVFDNNLSQVSFNMNKVGDAITLSVNNIPFPHTINTLNEQDFREACDTLGYPVIIKHSGSGQGLGVNKADNKEEVDLFITKMQEDGKKFKTYVIQEFIPYVQDIRVLVIGGEVIGGMQRIPKEGEFRANFSRGGSVKMLELSEDIKKLASDCAKATNAVNAGVDVLVTADGKKYILEVNRTPGFEGFESATGKDIASLIMEKALRDAY
jgi:RimK family alpha-L-glutamate ligase